MSNKNIISKLLADSIDIVRDTNINFENAEQEQNLIVAVFNNLTDLSLELGIDEIHLERQPINEGQ